MRYVQRPLGVFSLVPISLLVHACSVVSDSFVTPRTVARQALLFMGLSRQGHWSGLPRPPPGGLPDPGIEPTAWAPALAGRFFTASATWQWPAILSLGSRDVFL